MRCLRYGLYGAIFTAPTLYAWVRLTSRMWKPSTSKRTTIINAIKKSMVEQVTYGPAAMTCFFFGMELMESYSVEKAKHEVQVKFWQTYTTGLCFWPIFQTMNFAFVAEKNRVVAVSLASFLWTIYLSYMKQLEEDRIKEQGLLARKVISEAHLPHLPTTTKSS